MTDYTVTLSKNAVRDIDDIAHYIRDELHNPSAAEHFVDDTIIATESIRDFPYSHMVRPGSRLFHGMEKRQYPYRKEYCLFYVINEKKREVRILRVIYSRRDLDRLI